MRLRQQFGRFGRGLLRDGHGRRGAAPEHLPPGAAQRVLPLPGPLATTTELNPAINRTPPTGRLSHTSGANTLYRWSNPANPSEAFYLEAIYKSDQNLYQPTRGWRYSTDPNGDNSTEWKPYVQMEHADGRRDPENNVNLKRWTGSAWATAVESAGPSSTEAFSYNAQAGYYRIIVNLYSGTDSYKLMVSK